MSLSLESQQQLAIKGNETKELQMVYIIVVA
jgi:hypothetical protein